MTTELPHISAARAAVEHARGRRIAESQRRRLFSTSHPATLISFVFLGVGAVSVNVLTVLRAPDAVLLTAVGITAASAAAMFFFSLRLPTSNSEVLAAAWDELIVENDLGTIASLPSSTAMVENLLATNGRDWSAADDTARLYAIVLGWDGDPDDPSDHGAWNELATRYHWSLDLQLQLREAHRAWQLIAVDERASRTAAAEGQSRP